MAITVILVDIEINFAREQYIIGCC